MCDGERPPRGAPRTIRRGTPTLSAGAQSGGARDTVVCFLEGGFTTVERTLIDDGRADAVHDMRRSFQSAMESGFTRVVEEAMGHKVVAYMSQIHTSPDLAVELFVLGTSQDGTYAQHEETMS